MNDFGIDRVATEDFGHTGGVALRAAGVGTVAYRASSMLKCRRRQGDCLGCPIPEPQRFIRPTHKMTALLLLHAMHRVRQLQSTNTARKGTVRTECRYHAPALPASGYFAAYQPQTRGYLFDSAPNRSSSHRKCDSGITARCSASRGAKPIWSNTSRSRSIPGAISNNSVPSGVSRNPARSVR